MSPPSATGSLGLDRYYVSRGTRLLDMRLVALSFVVNALGKPRARRLLIASGLLSRRLTCGRIDRNAAPGQTPTFGA